MSIEPKPFITFNGVTPRPFDQDAGHVVSRPVSPDGVIGGMLRPQELSKDIYSVGQPSTEQTKLQFPLPQTPQTARRFDIGVEPEFVETDQARHDGLVRPSTGVKGAMERFLFGPEPKPKHPVVKGLERMHQIAKSTKDKSGPGR